MQSVGQRDREGGIGIAFSGFRGLGTLRMNGNHRTVLVTGGARGIGRACVEAFAAAGMRVVLNYRTSRAEACAVAEKFDGAVLPVEGDMSIEEDITRVFDTAEAEFGPVNILVNNAGILGRTRFPDLNGDAFLEMLRSNTVGPYRVARQFFLRLGEETGAVVNIGSMRAFLPSSVDYSASKAALHNMTVSLAKAMAPRVRVNAVAPGFTDTDMHAGNRERLEAEGAKALLGRYSAPEEIAEAVLFLVSDRARSITGQVLLADNGRSLV